MQQKVKSPTFYEMVRQRE